MKHLLKKTILFFAVTGTFACSNKPEADTDRVEEPTQVSTPRQEQPLTINDAALNAIYPHYVKLTTALVDGKKGESKLIASAIERGAAEVKGGAALQAFARQMLSAPNLGAERHAYAGLSNEFIAMVKKTGVKNGELYRVVCPMANNNEGAAWLSWSKEIRNPYFGKEMLSCGTVEETISEGPAKGAL
jgi:hypothetical protein